MYKVLLTFYIDGTDQVMGSTLLITTRGEAEILESFFSTSHAPDLKCKISPVDTEPLIEGE